LISGNGTTLHFRFKITANQTLPVTDVLALKVDQHGAIVEVCFVESKLRTSVNNMIAVNGYEQLRQVKDSQFPLILRFICERLHERRDPLFQPFFSYLSNRRDTSEMETFRLSRCWERVYWREECLQNLEENQVVLPRFIVHVIRINLSGGPAQLDEMINLLLPMCLVLSEMQPARPFSGSYRDLLRRWIDGTEIRDLILEFGEQAGSPEALGRFMDDLFCYRLPWGISGYIRIALKVLDIERTELSDFAKFFPSMVKFGLPDPVACWAMSVGIPSRRTAIEVAAAYRKEVTTLGYENFLEWLGTLNSERLHYDFGLTSPLLEDVHRVIFISGVNPLLRQFTSLEEFLPHEVEVQGIIYENRSLVALRAQVGQQVELVRDYDNLVDWNAMAVYLWNQQMGYIPRQEAQVLAPEIDTGAVLHAKVIRVKGEKPPRVWIWIELEGVTEGG
jgi:hypothetical protein